MIFFPKLTLQSAHIYTPLYLWKGDTRQILCREHSCGGANKISLTLASLAEFKAPPPGTCDALSLLKQTTNELPFIDCSFI